MKINISRISKQVLIHNADEFCVERTCDNIFTRYYELEIAGKIFHLTVCENHDEIIGQMLWNQKSPSDSKIFFDTKG